MALTKRELLQGGVSNQEALVKRLQTQQQTPPKKRLIPGGKRLMESVGGDQLETAVYNWLRGCRAFSQVTISFAKEPNSYRCTEQRVREFDTRDNREVWETHPEGRLHLAKQIADVLNEHQAVKLVAKKDGIWLYQDAEQKFSNVKVVTQADVDAQRLLVEEVKAEMTEAGEDPETLTYASLDLGAEVPADDWEPYIEFIPKRKKEYGR